MPAHNPARYKNKHTALYFVLSFVSLLFIAASLSVPSIGHAAQEKTFSKITVYKSPTCRCCRKWIKHLETNGFIVEALNREDMRNVKREMGIEPKYQSCHTATVDGYYIEGHVPADDIKRLLTEKPKATGLAVPGMPKGSPGMEVGGKDPYSVLLVKEEGSTEVYSKH